MGTINTFYEFYSSREPMMVHPFSNEDTIEMACRQLVSRLEDGAKVRNVDAQNIDLDFRDPTHGSYERLHLNGDPGDMESLRRIVLFWATGLDLRVLHAFLASKYVCAEFVDAHLDTQQRLAALAAT